MILSYFMHYRKVVRQLGLVLTPEQDLACAFLEARGFRFCVDFGYQNAVAKAETLWLLQPETRH